jgi:hypothetical protein
MGLTQRWPGKMEMRFLHRVHQAHPETIGFTEEKIRTSLSLEEKLKSEFRTFSEGRLATIKPIQ